MSIGFNPSSPSIDVKQITDMVTLTLELGLGLVQSLASMLIWILPLEWEKGVETSSHSSSMYVSSITILYWYSQIGIRYWIGL